MNEPYDLLIVGGGSAGLTAADFALQLGARVALVEKRRLGGDCTWSGCVPSKTLLKAARVAHQMRHADRYGLTPVAPDVDLKRVMAHVRSVIASVYEHESPEALRAGGIDVYLGVARFLDPHTLAVGQTRLTARRILLATGAHPYLPPLAGLAETPTLTYETVWALEELPRRLLVVGGGPIGCELAQAFQRLGSQVTLLAGRDRLLPREDPAASRVLEEVLTTEGVELHTLARAERLWQDGAGIHVAAGETEAVGDALLLVVGRRPNVAGLDLDKAGVAYSRAGIQADANLRTGPRHIYAAGDCLGGPQFTHYAAWQAVMAVRNMLLPGSSSGSTERVPRTTFTDPEVAHVGLSEAQARERFGDAALVSRWDMAQVDRARTEGGTAGF
ncbi:MAG TPA: FAD-dependent oxidoreductase, partial [Anaerolineae bacterium]|nr:FAD-dependent oxidoreductase [Anaerolineae bacterium]